MKRIFILILLMLSMTSLSYAVDLNNISFTNEDFESVTVTVTALTELSNGKLAVAYSTGSDSILKICDLDGTNCDSGNTFLGAALNVGGLSIFEDVANEVIHVQIGYSANGHDFRFNLSGSTLGNVVYNTGSTSFVSGVQSNASHFGITFQDTADSSQGKIIICPLSGAACGSTTTFFTGVSNFNKMIFNSEGNFDVAFAFATTDLRAKSFDDTGTQLTSFVVVSGSTTDIAMIEGTDNQLNIVYRDLSDSLKGQLIQCDLDGTNCGSEIEFVSNSQDNSILEIDNRLFIQYSNGDTGDLETINMNLTGGDQSNVSLMDGDNIDKIDSIFTSAGQMIASYNDATTSDGSFAISEVFAPVGAIVTINNPVDASFQNFTSTPLNVSTDINTNLTYIFNGGSEIFICNNCNSSTNITLTAVEGLNNLTVFSNLTGILTNNTSQFTVDIINPSLSVNLPPEFNAYTGFNFTSFINFSDTNVDTCIVVISGESSTVCLNQSYDFTTNGNKTINVTVTDLAGNTNTSLNNLMLINPLQLFNFQSFNGTPITNFVFGGLNFTTQANISTFNSIISFGNNTLLFEKLGFASTNVSFNINSTSDLNITTNITQSQINIRIFDRETNQLLTGLTQITLQASIGFNGSTNTGLINISNINFIDEQYQILAEHVGFLSESVFFDYNNQEVINIDIFMLNSSDPDAGQIQIIVKNSLSQFVESTVCSALEWRASESAFVSVAQGLTNVNGETLLNIELNTKIYQFSCTKDTFTTVTNAQIVQTDLSTLTIILNDILLAPTPLFENLLTSLTNTTLNVTHQLITYTFADSDGLTTEACLQTFLVNGNRRNFDSETCVSSSTGTILVIVNINQTSDILLQGVLTTPEVIDYVTDTLNFKGTGDISFQFAKIGLDILIPTIFMLLGLGLGILLSNINIGVVLMAVGGWLAVALVPTVLSTNIAMFITVIVALILYGGFTKK